MQHRGLVTPSTNSHSTITTMSSDQQTGSGLAIRHAAAIKDKVIMTTGVTLGTLGSGFVLAIARAQPSLPILAVGRSSVKNQQTAQAVTDQYPTLVPWSQGSHPRAGSRVAGCRA